MDKITIVLNLYLPKEKVLERVFSALLQQKGVGKIELILVDKKLSNSHRKKISSFKKRARSLKIREIKTNEYLPFAASMNIGIKEADGDIVVLIQQDCIPASDDWLKNLVSPLKDSNVVATVSNVRFPDELWNQLNAWTKSLMIKEKGTITPLLDEKGCAYRKSALLKVGLFNEVHHKTAGEDMDMYLKLKKIGQIRYPNATIIHYHPANLNSRLKKLGQFANADGTLVRRIGKNLPQWYFRIMKAIPLAGVLAFIARSPWNNDENILFPYLLMTPLLHFIYFKNFWKGFLAGKQTLDVFEKNNGAL